MAKIVDNPSAKELLDQIRAFESLEALYKAIPFAKHIFPGGTKTFTQFQDIKRQAEILLVPDQFNMKFAEAGWIAYESMNLDRMVQALSTEKTDGLPAAEQLLADYYNAETIKYGIMRFYGHVVFRRRIRLIELAKEDYLSGRFHACIPLLLSLLDGIVNDVSRHVGFFADGVNVTAWDSIAAHETGLAKLSKIMRLGRNKTNEDTISVPYRNGILHGRELAFDNHIVAAKCWAALFAVRDWAGALADGKATAKPKEKKSWSELFQQIADNEKLKRALAAWSPRTETDLKHLPSCGPATVLPKSTPEYAVADFLDNWCNRRFGLMANALFEFSTTHKGKKAGIVREDFGRCNPTAYNIITVIDEAAAISQVDADIVLSGTDTFKTVRVSVRAIFSDADNRPAIRGSEAGCWKIVQNSFNKVIYEPQV